MSKNKQELVNYKNSYDKAEKYYENNEYDKAIIEYSKSIDLKADYAEAYNSRGNVYYYNKKEYEKAFVDYNKAIELKPDYAEPYNGRGNTYYMKGEYEKALEDYNKAIDLKPDYIKPYLNKGNVYIVKNKYDDAIVAYNKAIELKPDYPESYNCRGICYADKGEYEKALKDYNRAIELKPYFAEAYNGRGIIHNNIGEYEKALEDYNKAIELKLDYVHSYNNRGVTYYNRQEYEKAIIDYNRAIELDPNYALAILNKGYALKKLERNYEDAKICFEKAKELYSIEKDSYRLEKIEESIKELDEYIKAEKQEQNKFTKILKETTEIFNNSETKKRSFLNFIIPRKINEQKNYLEVLRRWNSYTPIVADNFHISKGGGYFTKINGKGIVIDPGFNFIENFKGMNHFFDEIDIVLITHAHNDHTADIESILTLLYKYNENIKASNNSEDKFTIEYDLVQKYGEKWSGFGEDEKSKLIDKEFENSARRKIIDIFITPSTFKKYVGMFELMKSTDYRLHIIEAGYEKNFKDDGFIIKAIRAKHFDIMSDNMSVGFSIEFDNNIILYTGDTGVDKKLVEDYKEIAKDAEQKNLVLLAHMGGFKNYENKYKEGDEYKSFYKNHLGRLGLVEINNLLNPKICLISEFGEEFKDRRIELSEIMDKIYEDKIKFLPADIGLRLNFNKDLCSVYGISKVDIDTLQISKNDIKLQDTGICLLRKDYSLHYYDKSGSVKEGNLMQALIDEYDNSTK